MSRADLRQGSRMSDRQLARAATSGRSLVFRFTDEPLEGYLVGSDDFHWLVAHRDAEDSAYTLDLVHKASAPRIRIAPAPTLPTESPEFQNFVTQIGKGFWNFCDKTYLGKKGADADFAGDSYPSTATRQKQPA